MRLSGIVAVGLLATSFSTPTSARCMPYPAYVYEGEVLRCHAATDSEIFAEPDAIWEARVREDMKRGPVSVVVVSVNRLVQVARCDWEKACKPAIASWDEVTPTEFRFQSDGTCSTLGWKPGLAQRFYAVRPCCDSNIARGVRCALGLRVILNPPEWAEDLVQSVVRGGSRPN